MSKPKTDSDWNEGREGDGIYVESGFGVMKREPFVQISIRLGDEVRIMQMTPDNARQVARNLFESAEAAEMDAIVIKFMQERVHQTLEIAANILMDFREMRAALRDTN